MDRAAGKVSANHNRPASKHKLWISYMGLPTCHICFGPLCPLRVAK
jgi:hypothetical protein